MRAARQAIHAAWALIMLLGCAEGSIADGPSANPGPTVASDNAVQVSRPALTFRADTLDQGIDVWFERPDDMQGPRVMELLIEHSPGLEYRDAVAGTALTDAGKDLVVQSPEPGQLRVVALSSTNVAELGVGQLLTLHFTRVAPSQAGADTGTGVAPAQWVRFAAQNQVFAPMAANAGLLLGDDWAP